MSVIGTDEIIRRLHAMSQKGSRRVLAGALRQGAEQVRDAAESRAKRAAGAPDLADHIVVSGGRASGDHEAVILVGPSKEERSDQPGKTFAEQGRFLETGTSDTPAQPFLRPALDEVGESVGAAILEELWRQIAEEAQG